MTKQFRTNDLWVRVIAITVTLLAAGAVAQAGREQTNGTMQTSAAGGGAIVYRWDTGQFTERFNNSQTTETEDNWVANAFEVVDGGTRLLSIEYPLGETFIDQPLTAIIYLGADISDPSGLVRIQTTETAITGVMGSNATIMLDDPVDLNVGDVFYAAILIRNVTGNLFPFYNQGISPQGHSFFDVGPKQGAPYDLDVTDNVTVLGGVHPVVTIAQGAGNLFLRVNATVTPQ
jgi:hypothetical protein